MSHLKIHYYEYHDNNGHQFTKMAAASRHISRKHKISTDMYRKSIYTPEL